MNWTHRYEPIEPTAPVSAITIRLAVALPDADGFWRVEASGVVAYRRDPERAVRALLEALTPQLASVLAGGTSVVIERGAR